jgi:hypothetical protein
MKLTVTHTILNQRKWLKHERVRPLVAFVAEGRSTEHKKLTSLSFLPVNGFKGRLARGSKEDNGVSTYQVQTGMRFSSKNVLCPVSCVPQQNSYPEPRTGSLPVPCLYDSKCVSVCRQTIQRSCSRRRRRRRQQWRNAFVVA